MVILEEAKANCGNAHLTALETNIEYCIESTYDRFAERFTR